MSNILFKLSDASLNEKLSIPPGTEEEILGQIISNRIVGIAINNIDFSCLNKETQKALIILSNAQNEAYDIFMNNLKYICSLMQDVNFNYALLKGAYLSPKLYKRGQRTSNDIDILIESKYITELQNLLKNHGFTQGYIIHGEIVAATRADIINSKMNYGETIPFVKYHNGNALEIDLNFSVDFKARDTNNTTHRLLESVQSITIEEFAFKTLSDVDFLIHLCCHLYKEATTYDWLIHRRDLMLYKFSDINVYLRSHLTKSFAERLSLRIKDLGVERACYYALYISSIIYPSLKNIEGFNLILKNIQPFDLSYLKQIVFPKEHKTFTYDVSFEEWFTASNRLTLLK